MSETIFHCTAGGALIRMNEQPYATEDQLQAHLAQHHFAAPIERRRLF